MKKKNPTGLLLNGSLKKSGITFYLANGKTVMRSAYSLQPKRRTRAQFDTRQRFAHSTRLWAVLKLAAKPMFEGGATSYNRFLSLMRLTPVVYTPCKGKLSSATLLLPGMPVSDGALPPVELRLGEVDGTAALLTSLTAASLRRNDTLRLYTLRQYFQYGLPKVMASVQELSVSDFQTVDGCLALVGDNFADDMAGWALVHIRGAKCSSQQVVTRCTVYQSFTTEEAFAAAAESYGGLTQEVR